MQLDAGHSYQHQQSDENFAQVEAKNNQSTSKTSIGGASAGDKITKLLEASSEKLKKCKKDKMLRYTVNIIQYYVSVMVINTYLLHAK